MTTTDRKKPADRLMRLQHAATMTDILLNPLHVVMIGVPSVFYSGYSPKGAPANFERVKAVVLTTGNGGVYYGVTQTVDAVQKELTRCIDNGF